MSGAAASTGFWMPRKLADSLGLKPRVPRQRPKLTEPLRPVGKPAGSYMDGITAQKQCVILCWRCAHKFNYRQAHYFKEIRHPEVMGRCDGCRQDTPKATLFIWEGYLLDPGGRTRSGQSWNPG